MIAWQIYVPSAALQTPLNNNGKTPYHESGNYNCCQTTWQHCGLGRKKDVLSCPFVSCAKLEQ